MFNKMKRSLHPFPSFEEYGRSIQNGQINNNKSDSPKESSGKMWLIIFLMLFVAAIVIL